MAGTSRAGKLRERLLRNRTRLGPNFKEVVAYLDSDDAAAKKTPAKRGRPPGRGKGRAGPGGGERSEAMVVDDDAPEQDNAHPPADDEEHDDEIMDDFKEGGAEDLRNRELVPEVDEDDIEDDEGDALDARRPGNDGGRVRNDARRTNGRGSHDGDGDGDGPSDEDDEMLD